MLRAFFTFLTFSAFLASLAVHAEETPAPPAKEEAPQAVEKPAEASSKGKSKTVQAGMDETIQYLRDRLKSLEASAEISASFKEDGKTMVLRFYRGSTVMNLELDPQSNDLFYDILLKEVKPVSKEKAATGKVAGTRDPETDESLKRLKERVESLEFKMDLMLEELRKAGRKPPVDPDEEKPKPPSSREPRPPREPRETPEPQEEPSVDPEQEALTQRLKGMIDSLEQKKQEPPKGRNGQGVPQEALSHIYQAQRFFYGKDYKAALKELDRSLELGETALALALKGTVHVTMGDKPGAVKSWQRALELDPTMTDVQKALNFYGGSAPK